jgi:hypothetical protein
MLTIPTAATEHVDEFRASLAKDSTVLRKELKYLDEGKDLMAVGLLSPTPLSPVPEPVIVHAPISAPVPTAAPTATTTSVVKMPPVVEDINHPPTTGWLRFAPPTLSTPAMQGLTIAAILLAPLMSSDGSAAPVACACASDVTKTAVVKMGWGMWLLRALMWALALTPATMSLIDGKKGWWAFCVVLVGMVSGLAVIST